MPRKKPKSASPLTPLLITLSLLVAVFGVYSYLRFRPVGPAEIFTVDSAPLVEGPALLAGTLLKDAPAGEPGTYFLSLPDGRVLQLDIKDNLDSLLGESVTIDGLLSLPDSSSALPLLLVNSLVSN